MRETTTMDGRRGQAYTLEGVVAAVVVLTSLYYGVQIVDVGPRTSTAPQETGALETRAEDLLTLAAGNGTLDAAVRCYGVSGKFAFDGSELDDGSTTFERMLNRTFDSRGRSYNVYFAYLDPAGGTERVLGSLNSSDPSSGVVAPSDSAAVATHSLAVFDDMPTRFRGTTDRDCGDTGVPIKEFNQATGGSFYIDDVAPNSSLYNIVEVRLVVW